MRLLPLNVHSVRLGEPLPYALRGDDASLLAPRGYIPKSHQALEDLLTKVHGTLHVDADELQAHEKSLHGQLDALLRQQPLGRIGSFQPPTDSHRRSGAASAEAVAPPDWSDLQLRTHALLRDPTRGGFADRLEQLHGDLQYHLRRNPDAALLALLHLSTTELHFYSATHALLVSVICSMVARDVLHWPDQVRLQLERAALTMNIGMTELQDQLSLQKHNPSAAQMLDIQHHAERSVELMQQVGVSDPVWLAAVRNHHLRGSGNTTAPAAAQQMSMLLQRADTFAARLAPRASRRPLSPAAAVQASYFDENRRVDPTGAALVKAIGVYPPGSYVRLLGGEVAVVLRRGKSSITPRVAVLLNRSGMPTGEPILRDTSQSAYRIAAGIAQHDLKLNPNLQSLLRLN